MYNYEWDNETGGYLLTTRTAGVIKEVRPVFFEELILLGFDRALRWIIPNVREPLLWAEGRRYFYFGEQVAEAVGGSMYEIPEIVGIMNLTIVPTNVVLMVEKNRNLLEGLEQKTKKFIYDTYKEYSGQSKEKPRRKVDIVYVAFSGGKDSIVLLDLVQKSLPHDKFKVLFADTTMELCDTYKSVEIAKKTWSNLDWIDAKSEMSSLDSWKEIGPPAEKMRWCCAIHKTAPQVIAIKKLLEKNRFKTLVYVGVRAEESEARSNYDDIAESKKHIMQTSCCPILDWSTSELFVYLLKYDLIFNDVYRKGLARAGCVVCPMSSKWSFMINNRIEPDKVEQYTSIISSLLSKKHEDAIEREDYYNNRKWKLRLNGRDLSIGENRIIESEKADGYVELKLLKSNSDWRKWISTFGILHEKDKENYQLDYKDCALNFRVIKRDGKSIFTYKKPSKTKNAIRMMYLFRNALNKVAYCVNCKVCEAECPEGAIKFFNNNVEINGCIHCENCLDRQKGCIVAQSLSIPVGGKMEKKSIAVYETRGFRQEWLEMFFEYVTEGKNFWKNERMGPNMFKGFRKWLEHAELINEKTLTELTNSNDSNATELAMMLTNIANKVGAESLFIWAVIYTNLAYKSPIVNWYVDRIERYQNYDNETFEILLGDKHTRTVKESALKSLKETFKDSPIGDGLKQAYCEKKGNMVVHVTKEKWQNIDPLSALYGLYKYAEATSNYSFVLADMFNAEEESGITLYKLYGLDRIEMQDLLTLLSKDYPEFVRVAFSKGQENVDLAKEHKAIDIVRIAVSNKT